MKRLIQGILIIASGVSLPATGTTILFTYIFLNNSSVLIKWIAVAGGLGYAFHVLISALLYFDCINRPMSKDEREFWKTVLFRGITFCTAAPVYYWEVLKCDYVTKCEPKIRMVNGRAGDIAYYVFKYEFYLIILCFSAAAVTAGLSIVIHAVVDIPKMLFVWAVYLIIPVPVVIYFLILTMMHEFVHESRDFQDFKYYFSYRKGFLGAIQYYRERRRSKSAD